MKKITTKAKTTKKKRAMKSFEAEADVEQMLDDAEKGGLVFKQLVNEAIRKYGPEVLREAAEKMREQAKVLEAAAAKQNTSSGKR